MALIKQTLNDEDHRYIWKTAKYESDCAECTCVILQGDKMLYDTKYKKAYCDTCGVEIAT